MSTTDPTPEPESQGSENADPSATDAARDSLVGSMTEALGEAVIESHVLADKDVWVRVTNAGWAETAEFLRNGKRFRFFDWLSAIDWMPSPYGRSLESIVGPAFEDEADAGEGDAATDDAREPTTGVAGGESRFQIIARLYSLETHMGVTLKADIAGEEPGHMTVPSLVDIYPGAAWHEREASEMFGITFVGNKDLRNIYLPTGFEGHPLRKDYPLMARLIKPWPGIVDVEPMPEVASGAGPSTTNPEAG